MFRQRVVTAVVLLAILLPALFFSPGWLWAFVLFFPLLAAAWEWRAFMQSPISYFWILAVSLAGICVVLFRLELFLLPASGSDDVSFVVYGVAVVFWSVVVPLWLKTKWCGMQRHPLLGLLVAIIVIVPTWLAMIQLRAISAWLLLAVMSGVWLADIGAYAVGKKIGKHKLAPTISPGKTWEGALGGALAVVLFGSFVLHETTFSLINWFLVIAGLLGFATFSILGDLFESLLKRQAGLKDSSQFLPGHGGVMDRIDSLTAALPFAALIAQSYA